MLSNFIDVSEVFEEWEVDYPVERNTGGYVDGIWTQNDTESFTISAALFKPNFKDLKILPQGFEIEKSIKLLSKSELLVKKDSDQIGDEVYYNEKWWRVHSVFQSEFGGYYRIFCISDEK